MKVGFIGLGTMGSAIAMNILRAGHELTVWNRSKPATHPLDEAGATVADAIEDSVLLVHSDALVNPESLKHPRERDGIYLGHLTSQDGWRDLKVERRVAPVDGKPLFWHYSWVRPSKMGADGKPDGGRAALKAKVANWGHKDDTLWSTMIDRAFDRIEEGCWPDRDFVHGYTLKLLD